ncbi:prion-inhibition and propagation-domain-containing protein [Whalleya microplaca]|nr:prion-inhibition and propagation-domain-containing protein [Whalleya microplaca]
MAEVLGLALSGVALVSLFTTCLDFINYFDDGKAYLSDAPIAVTKVRLLKTRLRQWGDDMNITNPDRADELLDSRCPEDGKIIQDSLIGIKTVLGTVSRCAGKHRMRGDPAIQSNAMSFDSQISLPLPNASCKSQLHLNHRVPSGIKLLLRRTTWALQDKRKLNASIDELEFLIANLEKVSKGRSCLISDSQVMPSPPVLPSLPSNQPENDVMDRQFYNQLEHLDRMRMILVPNPDNEKKSIRHGQCQY